MLDKAHHSEHGLLKLGVPKMNIDTNTFYNDLKTGTYATLFLLAGLVGGVVYFAGKSAQNISKQTKVKADVKADLTKRGA